MDTLSNAVFGMEIDMQNNQRNKFFDNFTAFINSASKFSPFVKVNCKKNFFF